MATPKGNSGYAVFGDKSAEFYKDPIAFVTKRIDEHGARIFQSRILNKPTVFVCTVKGVRDLLVEQHHHFEMGYKAFMYQLYGDNIMFSDAVDAARLHGVIHSLFGNGGLPDVNQLIDRLIERHLSHLDSDPSTSIYNVFKRFATELSLAIFLGLDAEKYPELVEECIELTTTHWHGIISVPLSVKLPSWSSSWSSGYSKAIEAKDQLLKIINSRISNADNDNILRHIKEAGFDDTKELAQHLLCFVSALVPKALSSLLTSFTLMTAGPEKEAMRIRASDNSQYLHKVLLEVQRLVPPFIGGRRLTRKDSLIDGYKVPEGTAVIYITYAAHRDPSVFKKPDKFRPERWIDGEQKSEDVLSCFGGGPRSCVGVGLMKNSMMRVCSYLLDHYEWRLPGGQDLTYKWLPVSRPKDPPYVVFCSKGEEETEID
ncbi:putative cytochrome P450 120 isoform X2 [Amphiura filiformis]|uniref:putative cytochrome P450 120 isoform X2 n=1 Tax=Amphiura filiformis TaxID=82378 RepID=UPI003B22479A